MKKRTYWLSLILGIMAIIVCIPTTAFAYEEYTADYYGEPSLEVGAGGELSVRYMESDYVIVHKSEGDLRCEFDSDVSYYDDEAYISYDLYDENGESLYYEFYLDEDNNVILYIDGDDWSATAVVNNAEVYNEVSRITFEPSDITLYAEEITSTDEDGEVFYDLRNRSVHSHEGETWPSSFAVGDKLVVYYENGRTKTFINKDYYDDEDDEWSDAFFCGDEPNYDIDFVYSSDDLKVGTNTITVEHNGRSVNINANIEEHKWDSDYTIDKIPTCSEEGSKSIHCSLCTAKKDVETIEKKPHEYSDWNITKKPTYSEMGLKERVCGTCGDKVSATIPKLVVKTTSLSKVAAAKKAFTAKWKKSSNITGYEIQYALNSKFTKSKKTVKITKATTVSKKIKKLKAKKKYYVRVRTYVTENGTKYYSAWSKYKTVKTK